MGFCLWDVSIHCGIYRGCQGTFEEPQKRKPGKHALQTYCNSLQTKLCLLLCSKILWSSSFRISHNLDWLDLSKTRLMISLSLCDLLYLSCSLLVSPKNLSKYCFWFLISWITILNHTNLISVLNHQTLAKVQPLHTNVSCIYEAFTLLHKLCLDFWCIVVQPFASNN